MPSDEIYVSATFEELYRQLEAACAEDGWLLDQPNCGLRHIKCIESPRGNLTGIRAVGLSNYGDFQRWAEKLKENIQIVGFVGAELDWTEWRDGKEFTGFDHDWNGEIEGVSWFDLLGGDKGEEPETREAQRSVARKHLGEGFRFDEVSLKGPQDNSTMFKVVIEALHGQRGPGAREFTVSRRCQRIDSNSSVNCFLEKLYRRSAEPRAVLPGVGTLQAQASHEPSSRKLQLSPKFIQWFKSEGELDISFDAWQGLDPDLSREAFDIILGYLRALRDSKGFDVALGEWFVGWATHFEGYEGRNPRTGEVIKVPGTQMPSLFFGPLK